MTSGGNIAVIGLGNPIITDDAVGLKIAENIEAMGLPGVDCYKEYVGGLEILPLLRGHQFAVIVDAVMTDDYGPGSVMIFDISDFDNTVHDNPAHGINLATAVKIGRRDMPEEMPEEIKFVAVEVSDMVTVSEIMTPAVKAAVKPAENAVLHVVDSFRSGKTL